MITHILALIMLWTVALALPHGETYTPNLTGVSSRDTLDKLLGINCRGSILCGGCNSLGTIKDLIDKIPDYVIFNDGQQIACQGCDIGWGHGGICAFPQRMKGGTLTAKQIKDLMWTLSDHGCKGCGSVPVFPGNNVGDGELTLNWVRHTCRSGVC